MADPVTESSQAIALRTEMQDIMTNKANPMYEGYRKQDPAVMKSIDDKYKAAYGNGVVKIGTGVVGTGNSETGKEQSQEQVNAQSAETLKVLKTEWGDSYEGNMTVARAFVSELSSEDKILFQRAADAIGDDVAASKLLLKLAQRRNG